MIVLAVLLFDNAVTSSRLDSHFVMEIKVQDLHKSFGKENIMDEKIPRGAALAPTNSTQLVGRHFRKKTFDWVKNIVGMHSF